MPQIAARRRRCHECGELPPKPKPAKKPMTSAQVLAAMRRLIDAYRDRVSAGDVEALSGLADLRDDLEAAVDQAVITLRAEHAVSWAQVAEQLRMTRRGAIKRWAETAPGTRTSGGQPAELR